MAFDPIPLELAREGIEFLMCEGEGKALDEAEALLRRLAPPLLSDDRIVILRARCLRGKGDHAGVLSLLQRDFACVREGEHILSDLWIWAHAHALASARGVGVDEALLREAECLHPVPEPLDFRLRA